MIGFYKLSSSKCLQSYLINVCVAGAESGSNERRLLTDLLEYYNMLERPVFNDSDAINLTFGLTLQQIIDVVRVNNQVYTLINQPGL